MLISHTVHRPAPLNQRGKLPYAGNALTGTDLQGGVLGTGGPGIAHFMTGELGANLTGGQGGMY